MRPGPENVASVVDVLVGISVVPPVARPAGLDVGEPFAGYSHNVGLFPLPSDVLAKSRQWCRALQRQIWATWWAAVETDTHLAPGGAVHDEAEAVMVEAGLSVASVQVLYEIFLGAYPRLTQGDPNSSAFEAFSHTDGAGQVVSGLKLIRNGEMHADCIVVPDIQRVVGVTFEDGLHGYRIFPHWVSYGGLPPDVREARYPPKGSVTGAVGKLKTNQIHHDHYNAVVGGHLVIETLLDAFAFFARCDPRIVRLNQDGGPRHFPLEPISERDYERRHPEWRSRAEVEEELRELCESNPPGGTKRTCVAHLQDATGAVVAHCGYTEVGGGRYATFTETPEQVLRDVTEFGYPYWMQDQGVAWPVIVNADGDLVGDGSGDGEQSHLGTTEELPWLDWFTLARSDAFAYRDQRKP